MMELVIMLPAGPATPANSRLQQGMVAPTLVHGDARMVVADFRARLCPMIGALSSMDRRRRPAELHFAQYQRQRHPRERDQHQYPERIHVAEKRRLRLDLLPDPVNRLLLRLDQRAPLADEVVRHLLQRIL